MRVMARPLGLVALTAALFVLVLGASPAKADFGIERWEALTCVNDASAPGLGDWTANGDPCLETDPPTEFFTQAAGHPNFGITAFLMNQTGGTPNFPEGSVKELRVDLPAGLAVNPEATVQCTVQQLEEGPLLVTACPPESLVGFNYLTTISSGAPGLPPAGTEFTLKVPVYNVEPFFGVPSMAGFRVTAEPTILVGALDPVDQHISFTIFDIDPSIPLIGSRLVFNGKAGTGYLTMPTTCAGPLATVLNVTSHPFPPPSGPELHDTAVAVSPVGVSGCENVPFAPTIDMTTGPRTDSPEPVTVNLEIPFNPDPNGLINSHLRHAKATLPEGMGINPSSANGLVPCTDAQFAKGTNDPITCPDASKVGTVEVITPSLSETLGGTIYIGQPLSNDASSGNQFRIFVHVSSPRFGVNVRLIGNVFPNLATGQVTAVVRENPQAPFSSFKLHFDGGPRGTLTTPGNCGPHTLSTSLTPWSGNPDATPGDTFFLTSYPSGGPCPKTLAERPFGPGYKAGPKKRKAGAYSPFKLKITRNDGEQEIKKVDVHLPSGMVAKLRGVKYCPEANIAAASSQSGAQVAANPACPKSSLVGTAAIDAGSGPQPFHTTGTVYLAGPYKGAPLSLVFVTPAVAGPYDLGTVVIRVALRIDPETARVHAISDTVPHVFGGVKLDIRNIDVAINRKKFTLNPTNCRKSKIAAAIFGGGGNPLDPAAWSQSKPSSKFRAKKCGRLKFKPSFFARILGGRDDTQRADNPKFRAVLDARKGDANVRRASFILPRATILDQSHIKTICTRVQLEAKKCPKKAIYGHARATSPLIKGRLKGPVYLTSSKNLLPDLLVDLRGQVNVRLRGVISSKHGRLKTVFRKTPDVAVNKFVLTMRGGKRGLLVNSEGLCGAPRFGSLSLKGQNGDRVRRNLPLNIPACG
jgi:hypothetical protein